MLYNRINKENSIKVAENIVIKICEPDLTGTSFDISYFRKLYYCVIYTHK